MKAWLVREKDQFCAAVVFAETRGKARSLALHIECCEDVPFTDIEVHRMKPADKYYKEGKRQLDWEIAKDRIALVKDCGFVCDYDSDLEDCKICSVKEYCDRYHDYLDEEEGDEE